MDLSYNLPLEPPPCPVHSGSDSKRVTVVPDGFLAVIGPAESVAVYTGDSVSRVLVRPVPLEHPLQLVITMAPVDYDEWEGSDIEPLRGGAFALCEGVVIERNSCWHVCLYNDWANEHTILANWMIPSVN